jgi:hypothetical protein
MDKIYSKEKRDERIVNGIYILYYRHKGYMYSFLFLGLGISVRPPSECPSFKEQSLPLSLSYISTCCSSFCFILLLPAINVSSDGSITLWDGFR